MHDRRVKEQRLGVVEGVGLRHTEGGRGGKGERGKGEGGGGMVLQPLN